MPEMTVFYAWQNDLPSRTNRYFIRDAAKAAVNRLSADADIDDSPRLDSDTQNVPGTPDIAATIFSKIDRCGIFLCDLSFVGSTASHDARPEKHIPNPNVLLELGYAAARISWDRIICVMNEAYGAPDQLIFDIRHRRWPITYHLEESSSRDEQQQKQQALTKEIDLAIKAALQADHSTVSDILSRLDVNCLEWMARHGNSDYFPAPERRVAGDMLFNLALDAALPRLLDLGIIRCDVSPDGQIYGYYWTYIGKLALKKIGAR